MDDLIRGSLVVVLQVLPIGGWPRSRRELQSTLKVRPVPRLWGPGRRTYRVSRSASIRTTGRRAIAHSSSLPIEPLLLVASSAANWLKINCIQSFCCPRSPKARDRGHPAPGQDMCGEIVAVVGIQCRDLRRVPRVIVPDPVLRDLPHGRLVGAHRPLARSSLRCGCLR